MFRVHESLLDRIARCASPRLSAHHRRAWETVGLDWRAQSPVRSLAHRVRRDLARRVGSIRRAGRGSMSAGRWVNTSISKVAYRPAGRAKSSTLKHQRQDAGSLSASTARWGLKKP
jgi:hypothetical protein